MRVLIYVPIIHSEADMGTMAADIRARFVETLGEGAWARRRLSVDAMWKGIRGKLLSTDVPWERVRLYQDGLPVCNEAERIVRDLASAGSENHRLLVELAGHGATLMGTEDPELLVQDYRRIQKLVRAVHEQVTEASIEALKQDGDRILRERDGFIARRIDCTLQEGETGLLFMGLLHRVDEQLNATLDVRSLIHTLPFRADPWGSMEEK